MCLDWIFQFSDKKGHFPSLGPLHSPDMKTFLIDLPDPPWTNKQFNHFLAVARVAAKLLKEEKTILCVCVKGKDRSRALAHAAALLAGNDASHIPVPTHVPTCEVVERIRGRVANNAKKSAMFDLDNLTNILPLGRGLLIETDGNLRVIDGEFNGQRVRELIKCSIFQMVPCTVGKLAGAFELWVNETGLYDDAMNKVATAKLGKQVFGGKLYGNVLVVRKGTIP